MDIVPKRNTALASVHLVCSYPFCVLPSLNVRQHKAKETRSHHPFSDENCVLVIYSLFYHDEDNW